MLRLNRIAQSTAEYVIVLGLIVAAVVAMQTYVKRGFQGRIREAVDFTGQQNQGADAVKFSGEQYEPYYLDSSFSSDRSSEETEELKTGGAVERKVTEDKSTRKGYQIIKGTE